MKRSTLGAMMGLLIGGLVGCLWAYAMHRMVEAGNAWTNFPTLSLGAPTTGRVVWQHISDGASFYFSGALFGMGFGAVVGAIVGAAGAIVRALQQRPSTTTTAPPPAI